MSKPAWTNGGRTGQARKFQNLVIFACEGLICIIDERPHLEGECTIVTPSDMEVRITAADTPYRGQKRIDLPKWQRQEWDEIKRGCQDLTECIKEARGMGDPSDPAVQAWWSRHRRNSTIRGVSAGNDPAGYPALPIVPLGRITGRTAAIDGEAKVPLNVNGHRVPTIHKRPKRKNRSGIIVDL